MHRGFRASVLGCVSLVFASCGGGGGSSVAGGAPVTPSGPHATAAVTFTVAIPGRTPSKRGRLPAYISSATAQASIVYTPSDGGPSGTINTGCTTACTAVFQAPVGVDAFVITLQDSSGKALSRGATTALVTASQPNVVNATFDGIVHDATLRIAPATLPAGTAATAFMFVDAHDADGSTIVTDGTYVDASGAQILFTIGNPAPSTAVSVTSSGVSAPGTILPVTYTGAASLGGAFTLNTTAALPGAVAGATLSVVPSTVYTYPYALGGQAGHDIVSDGALHFYAYADPIVPTPAPVGPIAFSDRWSTDGRRRTQAGPSPGSGNLFVCCDGNKASLLVTSQGVADLTYDIASSTLFRDQGSAIGGYHAGSSSAQSLASGDVVQDLVAGTDGNVYFTVHNTSANRDSVGYITDALTVSNEINTPVAAAGVGRITYAHDGAAWYVESKIALVGRLKRFGPATAVLSSYALPHANDVPIEITDSPVQNAVMVLGYSNNDPTQATLWKIGYGATQADVYAVTLPAHACGCGFSRLHATADLALWTIDLANGYLVRIDMAKKTVVEFPVESTTNAFVEDFAFGADGSIMYVGRNVNGVGKLIW